MQQAAAHRLMQWDGTCDEKNIASAIFHVFHHRLMINLLVPALGEELCMAYVEIFNQSLMPIHQILRDPNSPWFSTKSGRQDLVTRSLDEACEELKTNLGDDLELWQWGKIHSLTLNHSLGRIKLLTRYCGLVLFHLEVTAQPSIWAFTGIRRPTRTRSALRYALSSTSVAGSSQNSYFLRDNPDTLFPLLRRSDFALACRSLC